MPHLSTEVLDASTVRLTYRLDAPVAKVFGMWARKDAIEMWFCPGEPWECNVPEYDFQPGGSYRVHMVAPDQDVYEVFGAFETISTDEVITFSWNWLDSPTHPEPSHVHLTFEPSLGTTKMTLTHSRFLNEVSLGRHQEGWNACVARLEQHLAE